MNNNKEKTFLKRYEFKIAFISLIGIFIISFTSLIKLYVDSKADPTIVINDANELRKLIKLPLEGTYRYTMDYPLFHSSKKEWRGSGKAFISWDNENEYYRMLLAGKVYSLENNPNQEPHVVYVLEAKIEANKLGQPINEKVHFEYITATGARGFNSRANHYFIMEKSKKLEQNEIVLNYKSSSTEGRAILIKE